MLRRFYLSTRKDSCGQAEALLEALRARGWQRTFDWAADGNVGPERYADTALAEIAAVQELT